MAKVTIIIESDELSTDNLDSLVRYMTPTEADFRDEAYARYQFRPEVKIFIVPSDEE